jgi:hypothetical protein
LIIDLTLQDFDSSVITLIEDANKSAAGLVNLLAKHFPCFNDEAKFERKKVRFLKRAQIFVADLWAAFDGQDYGEFNDIDKITMFAGTSSNLLSKFSLRLTPEQH